MSFWCTTVLIALALAPVQRQAAAQAPPQPACEGLLFESSDFCSPLNNCTGLVCTLSHTLTATFSVERCSDPLEISVAVTSLGSDGVNFFYVFTSSGKQANDGYTVDLVSSRNASYATIQAFDSKGDEIISRVDVFLDPHSCMCASLDSLIENIESPFETDCSRTPNCIGIECKLDIPVIFVVYQLEVDIEACQNPPGALVLLTDVDTNKTLIFHFNVSQEIELPLPSPFPSVQLSVNLAHQNYSSTVEIILVAFEEEYTLLPRHQVILDKSSCPPVITPTDIPTVTPERVITPETCAALREIVELPILQTLGISCSTTEACDTISCDVYGFIIYTQLLPCNQPPAILIEISDSNGIIYESVIDDRSTFINLENIATVQVLKNDIPTGITLEVRITIGRTTINLIDEHEIPFDVCYCPGMNCATGAPAASPTRSSPSTVTSPPTSEPSDSRLSAATVAAITVPIILLMVLVAVAVVAAAMIVVALKQRKSPPAPFPFKPMDTPAEDEGTKEIIESSTNEQEPDQGDY